MSKSTLIFARLWLAALFAALLIWIEFVMEKEVDALAWLIPGLLSDIIDKRTIKGIVESWLSKKN